MVKKRKVEPEQVVQFEQVRVPVLAFVRKSRSVSLAGGVGDEGVVGELSRDLQLGVEAECKERGVVAREVKITKRVQGWDVWLEAEVWV